MVVVGVVVGGRYEKSGWTPIFANRYGQSVDAKIQISMTFGI